MKTARNLNSHSNLTLVQSLHPCRVLYSLLLCAFSQAGITYSLQTAEALVSDLTDSLSHVFLQTYLTEE